MTDLSAEATVDVAQNIYPQSLSSSKDVATHPHACPHTRYVLLWFLVCNDITGSIGESQNTCTGVTYSEYKL